ncbi:unnamed protein product [Periconia digitata]|uniref:GmrSD restriction endonucleases C-terminal domain-containing protein n=1 Tax=Periconia digitata TaxID=1303443 RepID=A0A9W4XFV6_9PLEO|nr:unnamed protein product [Periconia digitata]
MKYLVLVLTVTWMSAALPAPVYMVARAPPNVPSTADAESALAALIVQPQGSQDGYSRDLFPHWISQTRTCNTREVVLKRDGLNVTQSASCAAVSGIWQSPFDGATWDTASRIDIDHLVPLSNAWKSGASSWTTAERQAFANDLMNPQLVAITDSVNRAKGDKGPERWKPPLTSYYCTYSRMWVKVKSVYSLSITSAEKAALDSMLRTC